MNRDKILVCVLITCITAYAMHLGLIEFATLGFGGLLGYIK